MTSEFNMSTIGHNFLFASQTKGNIINCIASKMHLVGRKDGMDSLFVDGCLSNEPNYILARYVSQNLHDSESHWQLLNHVFVINSADINKICLQNVAQDGVIETDHSAVGTIINKGGK